jgi:hypothetical protein
MLREDYLNLFEQDYCAAAIASVMEFKANGEIEEIKEEEQDRDPWFSLRLEELHSSILGLYSIRSIHSSLDYLKKAGVVREDETKGIGDVKSYQFMAKVVNAALSRRWVFVHKSESIGKFADEVLKGKKGEDLQSVGKNVDEISDDNTDAYKERTAEVENKEQEGEVEVEVEVELLPPVPPESESDFTEETPDSDPTPPSRWPKRSVQARGFGGRPKKVRDTSRSDQLRAMREGSAAAAPPKPCPTSDTPPQATVDLMRFVRRWNELVPAAPVQWDPRYDNPALLAKAAAEEKFVVGFDELCRKCQALQAAKAGPNDWAPDFDWLLGSDKEGGSRWWKVLKGKYDWKTGPKSNGNSTVAAAVAAHERVGQKYLERIAAKKALEEQHGTN